MAYSQASKTKLATAHPDLQFLFNEVSKTWSNTVTYGVRTKEEQEKLVAEGKSKTMNSKHLKQADGYAHAVDVYPDPLDWNDIPRFYYFAGYVLAMAESFNIKIRWGGDWDGDMQIKDNNFNDLVHWELII